MPLSPETRARLDAVREARYEEAVWFFLEHAGWGYNPAKETAEEGRLRGAQALAAAETEGRERGLRLVWKDDPWSDKWDGCGCGDAECAGRIPERVEQCLVYHPVEDRILDSLSGVDDATPEYRRVVEAQCLVAALARLDGA